MIDFIKIGIARKKEGRKEERKKGENMKEKVGYQFTKTRIISILTIFFNLHFYTNINSAVYYL